MNEEEYLKAARHLASATFLAETQGLLRRGWASSTRPSPRKASERAVGQMLLESVRDLEAMYTKNVELARISVRGMSLRGGALRSEARRLDGAGQHDLQPRHHQDSGVAQCTESSSNTTELQSPAAVPEGLRHGARGHRLGFAAAAERSPRGLARRAPRAKRVIFLFMAGAPSQLDLFDYKPGLEQALQGAAARERQQGPARHGDDPGKTQLVMPSMFGSSAGARTACGGASSCPTSPRWRTTSASSTRCTPTPSITTRPRPTSAPAPRSPARRAWEPG